MTAPAAPTNKQRQSQATQQRLLAAAFEEFQRHGLAGARVDRIAERAEANKRLIYVYFGDKEGLFDTVVARDVEAMLDAVPFGAHDLPGYAARLLDYLEDRPAVLRLFSWRNLERTETSEVEQASYQHKVARIAEAQRAGHLDATLPAVHLLALVLGAVGSWAVASPALRVAAGEDAARDHRRESVREAVKRLTGIAAGSAKATVSLVRTSGSEAEPEVGDAATKSSAD